MKKLLACTLILSLILMLAIPIPASACDGGKGENQSRFADGV